MEKSYKLKLEPYHLILNSEDMLKLGEKGEASQRSMSFMVREAVEFYLKNYKGGQK